MSMSASKSLLTRQWRLLLVYDIYRLLSVLVFLSIYFYRLSAHSQSHLFFYTATSYLGVALVLIYLTYHQTSQFEKLIIVSGTIDVLAITSMLAIIGNIQAGYGIMLNVTIAALSILVPGRIAIYFAALASCLLLCWSLVDYFSYNNKELSAFFYSGIYGAGFFATSLTALLLANRVRASERLAEDRSYELAGMQKINEYIIEHMQSGVVYVDEDKNIKLMNSAAKRLLNVEREQQKGNLQSLSPLLNEKFDQFILTAKTEDKIAHSVLDPFLRLQFFYMDKENHPGILIIFEDMAYISQEAQQLKLASLGRFSASIAHELRNPLGVISHAIQLLGDEESLSDEDNRLKELITKNCDRMNRIIKNVLQLSRREKSKPEWIQITPFLEQFKLDFCQANSCDLIINLPKTDQPSVVFDKSQLEQILVILCDNAMQHGKDEEGKAQIEIDVQLNRYQTLILVKDKGKGVPAENSHNIFEPFFTTLRTGTGMGLFIAKDLCEINQSRLSLIRGDKGTTFGITINQTDDKLI
jgi:two-component system, NtrC family, sensor histidine kinase PilS